MKTMIGFATQFYTLWNVTEEMVYVTDSYGKHWPSHKKVHYGYVKNISKSLDIVKDQFPGIPVDESLRGMTRSWTKTVKEDLSPELIKFGKYNGKTIEEIAKIDMNYIMWLMENAFYPETRELCRQLPSVQQKIKDNDRETKERQAGFPVAESGLVEVTITNNPHERDPDDTYSGNANGESTYYSWGTIGEGNKMILIFDPSQIHYVSGLYPYNMVIIDGKRVKVKGKTLQLNLEIKETQYHNNYVVQVALVK